MHRDTPVEPSPFLGYQAGAHGWGVQSVQRRLDGLLDRIAAGPWRSFPRLSGDCCPAFFRAGREGIAVSWPPGLAVLLCDPEFSYGSVTGTPLHVQVTGD